MEFFKGLFGQNGFMPHGHCYLWDPGLMRLHLISDFLIATAYFVIPLTLVNFVRKRRDLTFNWMFVFWHFYSRPRHDAGYHLGGAAAKPWLRSGMRRNGQASATTGERIEIRFARERHRFTRWK